MSIKSIKLKVKGDLRRMLIVHYPEGLLALIQIRVGKQGSIAGGFMVMDFISQPMLPDFHGLLVY